MYQRQRSSNWKTKLYDEELHSLYSSPIIRAIKSRQIRYTEHVACIERRNMYTVLFKETRREKTTWETRHRWENDIKMVLVG
jgi:hypothetical protein